MNTEVEKAANVEYRKHWAFVARQCIEIMDLNRFKGKTRDKMTWAFFTGANALWMAMGNTTAGCAYVVSIRGYSEVASIATMDQDDLKVA